MTIWDRLLASLDATLGFPERYSTKVLKLRQGFDNATHEHVILVEYRVKVEINQCSKPMSIPMKCTTNQEMAFIKELLTHDNHR
jgi:hypothetical protein